MERILKVLANRLSNKVQTRVSSVFMLKVVYFILQKRALNATCSTEGIEDASFLYLL